MMEMGLAQDVDLSINSHFSQTATILTKNNNTIPL